MSEPSILRLVIPREPPSGNHYKKFRVMSSWAIKNGRSVQRHIPSWYHTADAKDWWAAVNHVVAGRKLADGELDVSYIVYRGKGSRGDVDNYSKCILDALVRSGLIANDDVVADLHCHKRRDRAKPRTVIVIRPAQAVSDNVKIATLRGRTIDIGRSSIPCCPKCSSILFGSTRAPKKRELVEQIEAFMRGLFSAPPFFALRIFRARGPVRAHGRHA